MDSKIIEKINKLLALANNNPNESEAMAAALKAQALMVEHDISVEQLDTKTEDKQIVQEIVHASNKHEMKKWKIGLASIISRNFRCEIYMINEQDVVFYGFKDDARIAAQVFVFLYETGNKLAVRYYNKCKKEGRQTKGVMNTYLVGFRNGVDEVLGKQCLALMIVTPQEVKDSFSKMTEGWQKSKATIKMNADSSAYNQGKEDGRNTANSRSLTA